MLTGTCPPVGMGKNHSLRIHLYIVLNERSVESLVSEPIDCKHRYGKVFVVFVLLVTLY